jgi:CDP-diacylglycerol--glycerol-3-phosphate 3-phosphatidyltransferase
LETPSLYMNLPNKLTLLRLVLTMVFVAIASIGVSWSFTIGLLLFIAASITDWMDGAIARKHNLITTFGKLMDPLADKILMCSTFVILAEENLLPGWVVIVILSREFLVTGLRLVATSQGSILAADSMGKLKTILQISTAIYFLLYLASSEPLLGFMTGLFDLKVLSPIWLGNALIISMIVVTVLSGWRYIYTNKHLLNDA